MYYIYKIENLITKQIYIGMTGNPKHRWYSHCHSGQNSYIKKSIKEHGVENFTFIILKRVRGKEAARIAEDKMIESLNSLHPNGFNRNVNLCHRYKQICELNKKVRVKLRGVSTPFVWLSQYSGVSMDKIRKAFYKRTYLLTKEERRLVFKALSMKNKRRRKVLKVQSTDTITIRIDKELLNRLRLKFGRKLAEKVIPHLEALTA